MSKQTPPDPFNNNLDALRTLIQTHISRYAVLHFQDVYKLLHQATFGPGHAIINRDSAREWLDHELKINPPDSHQSLLESISPDDSLLRLHLRPYKAGGGQADPLIAAMFQSAAAPYGKAEHFKARWLTFEELVGFDRGLMERFPPRELALFGRVYGAQNWPAVHHSPQYVKTYRPAYRVLSLEAARQLCNQTDLDFIL